MLLKRTETIQLDPKEFELSAILIPQHFAPTETFKKVPEEFKRRAEVGTVYKELAKNKESITMT